MKTKKLIGALLIISAVNLYAIHPYVKGYKLYIRYVKHIPKYGLKATQLLKKLNITSNEELDKMIESGEIVEKVKNFNPKVAEGIKKILQKDKESFKIFLDYTYKGKIPLGCH